MFRFGNILYINKKVAYFLGLSTSTSFYFYRKHIYEKEMLERFVFLSENNVKLSGVKLQQRPAFGIMGYFQWLIPYHQSLKIPTFEGSKEFRHVGLGNINGVQSEFVSHKDREYYYLNFMEVSIPIECWVDYYRKTGHYPGDLGSIDINELNNITRTSEECNEDENKEVFRTTFGSIIIGINGRKTISTCRSSVEYAIHEEEKRRLEKESIKLPKKIRKFYSCGKISSTEE